MPNGFTHARFFAGSQDSAESHEGERLASPGACDPSRLYSHMVALMAATHPDVEGEVARLRADAEHHPDPDFAARAVRMADDLERAVRFNRGTATPLRVVDVQVRDGAGNELAPTTSVSEGTRRRIERGLLERGAL